MKQIIKYNKYGIVEQQFTLKIDEMQTIANSLGIIIDAIESAQNDPYAPIQKNMSKTKILLHRLSIYSAKNHPSKVKINVDEVEKELEFILKFADTLIAGISSFTECKEIILKPTIIEEINHE